MEMINGWKTYIAAGITLLSAVLQILNSQPFETVANTIGLALGLVGLRHAIEKKS
jgi:hypothetical protein